MPTTKDHLAKHDGQISRLEQVMTALAEAQVRTEDELERFQQAQAEAHARSDAQMAQLRESMNELSKAMADMAKAQEKTEQRWQAYLTVRPKN